MTHYSNLIDAAEELAMIAEDDSIANGQSGRPRSPRYGPYVQDMDVSSLHYKSFYRSVFDSEGRCIGRLQVPNLAVVNAAMDIRDHNKVETYESLGYPKALDYASGNIK